MQDFQNNNLLTTKQLAEKLGFHWQTIQKLARQGKIPCYKREVEGKKEKKSIDYRFDLEEVKKTLFEKIEANN